jgi:sugar-specific transcriptional regulator TrmB
MPKNHDENAILSKLEALGLSEKESRVYLALLSREYVGSSKLIMATGLHSQYVYDALTGLEERGLVHHVVKRGRKKFAAQTPKHLDVLVQEKKRTVDALIPQLLALSGKPEMQSFEVYQGVESFKAEEFQKLESAAIGSSLQIIGDEGTLFFETMAEDLRVYEELRIAKKISLRYIASPENVSKIQKAFSRSEYIEIRTLEGLKPGRINTNIWEDRVSINIYGTPVLTFSLSNREIAANYLNFFESLWHKCDPVTR